MSCKNTQSWASRIVALAVMLIGIGTTSCSSYKNVPASDWGSLSGDEDSRWIVTTSDTKYHARGLTASDSTIILQNAFTVEEQHYPAQSVETVADSDLQLVIPFGEVESVKHREFSGNRTIVAGSAVLIGGAVVLVVLGLNSATWE